MKILHNRAKCRKCGDIIESHFTHDFKMCSCGSIFVDGGHDYMRWGGEAVNIEDLSEMESGIAVSKPDVN